MNFDVETMKAILYVLLAILTPAIVIAFGYLVKKVTAFINTKIDAIATSTNSETVKKYLEILRENATTIVNSLNQTIVDDLKAKSEDGKLTEEEIAAISLEALNRLSSTVSDTFEYVLGIAYDDLELLYKDIIEEAVAKVKAAKPKTKTKK